MAAAALAAAVLPAAAHAGTRFDYKQVFTTDRPGRSTGIDTTILYKHPNDPNAKPIPIRQEVFTFPVGTRFDDSVVPDCTASELELRMQGEAACPKESWVGGGNGNTTMTGFPGSGETPVNNPAFDYGNGSFRIVGSAEGFPARFVAHGHREGRTSTVDIPQTPAARPTARARCAACTTSSRPARSAGGPTCARRAGARRPASGSSRPGSRSPTAGSSGTCTGCPAGATSAAASAYPITERTSGA